jgi:hypothetical protein
LYRNLFIFILLRALESIFSKLDCAQIVVSAVLGQHGHAARVHAVSIAVTALTDCWTSYTQRYSCNGSEKAGAGDSGVAMCPVLGVINSN